MKHTITLLLTFICLLNAQSSNSLDDHSEALKMIRSENPTFKPSAAPQMTSKQIADLGFEQVYTSNSRKFKMRDGKSLHANIFEKKATTITVLLHGILSSSYLMNKTSGLLREALNSEIVTLDLRGHGQSDGNPGDVDYIDQYAHDLYDVISILKKEYPSYKILIAGHSMGGGIALRYSMLKQKISVDGYVLLAPHLGHNSPMVQREKTTNSDVSQFMKVHIERIIGLEMMNSKNIHKYDSLPVLFFNLPKQMPITKYSFRANKSAAPADYITGLKSVSAPMIVLIGSNDEAFDASEISSIVTTYSSGKSVVIQDETHGGIRHNKQTMIDISKWAKTMVNK